MSTGADVLAAQAMGADLAYLGTRFIATEESNASADYKQMVVDSGADDIVYTSLFSGVAANFLRDSVKRTGLDPDNLPAADKAKMSFAGGEPRVQGVARCLERRPERQRRPRGVAGERAGRPHGRGVRGGTRAPRAEGPVS